MKKLRKRWEPAHTDYSVCLVDCAFAEKEGGECDFWGGQQWGGPRGKELAQAEADRLNRVYEERGREGRFEVREHPRDAGWVHSVTIPLDLEAERRGIR